MTIRHLRDLSKITLLVFLCGFPSKLFSEIKLDFGLYTAQKPTELVRLIRPILNELELKLEERLGEPVHIKMNFSTSYEAGCARLRNQKSDFARLGAASFVLTKQRDPDITLLASENENGNRHFQGIIAVHKDSSLQTVEDLQGAYFAFGSHRSTSGRYYAQNFLYKHGIFSNSLSGFEYLDRHDRVASSVARQEFDAGAFHEKVFKNMVEQGAPLRAIASYPVETRTWVARSGLDPKITRALKRCLLSLNDSKALENIEIQGFLENRSENLRNIRQAIRQNHRFFDDPE